MIYYAAGPHQLFNVVQDPQELDNRYQANPAIANELERELRRICDPEEVNRRAHQLEREQLATLGLSNSGPNRPDVEL